MKQHSPRFLEVVNEARKNITEITPQMLHMKINNKEPISLIDVREYSEWISSGHIPTAMHLGKGVIERDIEKLIPDTDTQIVVYCSGGFRCALVADILRKMGYSQVASINTGLQGWMDAGYEVHQ